MKEHSIEFKNGQVIHTTYHNMKESGRSYYFYDKQGNIILITPTESVNFIIDASTLGK